MVREIKELLRELGWTDGFHVPGASEENKNLECEVEERMRKKAELMVKLEAVSERLESLHKYSKNIELERNENQQLIGAQGRQLETEYTLLHNTEADLSKTGQETREMARKADTIEERNKVLKVDLERSTSRLEQLKGSVEWGENAMLIWEEELARGDQTNELLEQYQAQDEAKFKELELQRQRLKAEVMQRQMLQDAIVSQMETAETQLNQTAKMLRMVNVERSRLIASWNDAVNSLKQRDSAIDQLQQECSELKEASRTHYLKLVDRRKFYEQQYRNNAEVARSVAQLNKQHAQQRQLNNEMTNHNEELNGQVLVSRRTVQDIAQRLRDQRSANAAKLSEARDKQAKCDAMEERVRRAKERLEEVSGETLTAAQRTRKMDEIYEMGMKANAQLQLDLKRLQEMNYSMTEELTKVKDVAVRQELEARSCVTYTRPLLDKEAVRLNSEIQQAYDLAYQLDIRIQKMSTQLAYLTGEIRLKQNEEDLGPRIHELEQALKSKTDDYNLIKAHVKRTENDLRYATADLERDSSVLTTLKANRQERQLKVEGGEKVLVSLRAACRERQVERNLLELRVGQGRSGLERQGEAVCCMERSKADMDTVMRERQVEIRAEREVLTARRRCLDEERSQLKKTIEHMNIRISQLQTKYQIAMDMLGKDEEGNALSITHFKIKAAQDKFMLQEQGDELDTKINKTEKEIRAMENTLKLVSSANDHYKRNLSMVEHDSPEIIEKVKLEEEYCCAVDALRKGRAECEMVSKEVETLEETLSGLVRKQEELQSAWTKLDRLASEMDRDLSDQHAKLYRAERLLRSQARSSAQSLHGEGGSKLSLQVVEQDMWTRELQEVNQSALQQLAELAARYIETGPTVQRYLAEKRLALPMYRGARSSTRLSGSQASLVPSVISSDGGSSSRSSMEGASPSIITLDPFAVEQPPNINGSTHRPCPWKKCFPAKQRKDESSSHAALRKPSK